MDRRGERPSFRGPATARFCAVDGVGRIADGGRRREDWKSTHRRPDVEVKSNMWPCRCRGADALILRGWQIWRAAHGHGLFLARRPRRARAGRAILRQAPCLREDQRARRAAPPPKRARRGAATPQHARTMAARRARRRRGQLPPRPRVPLHGPALGEPARRATRRPQAVAVAPEPLRQKFNARASSARSPSASPASPCSSRPTLSSGRRRPRRRRRAARRGSATSRARGRRALRRVQRGAGASIGDARRRRPCAPGRVRRRRLGGAGRAARARAASGRVGGPPRVASPALELSQRRQSRRPAC